jgi:hypothetical protein
MKKRYPDPKPPVPGGVARKAVKRAARRKTVVPRAGGMVSEYGRQIGEKAPAKRTGPKARPAPKKPRPAPKGGMPKIGKKYRAPGLKYRRPGRPI